jgi:hypothetical protein
MSRHKWDPVGSSGVRCRKCGLEVKSSDAKRGVGRCPGKMIPELKGKVVN